MFVGHVLDECMEWEWAGGLKTPASHRTANRIPSTSTCDPRTLVVQQQLPNDQDPPLYAVWGSSYKAMDEFGIGVGLYYRQLLTFAIVRLRSERTPVVSVVGRSLS